MYNIFILQSFTSSKININYSHKYCWNKIDNATYNYYYISTGCTNVTCITYFLIINEWQW